MGTYEGIRIQDICLNEDLTSWLPSRVHATIALRLKYGKAVSAEFKKIPKKYKLDVKANKYKLDGNSNALMFYPDDSNKPKVVLTAQQVQEVIAKYDAEKKNDGGNEETKEEEEEMPTTTANVSLSPSLIEEEE